MKLNLSCLSVKEMLYFWRTLNCLFQLKLKIVGAKEKKEGGRREQDRWETIPIEKCRKVHTLNTYRRCENTGIGGEHRFKCT